MRLYSANLPLKTEERQIFIKSPLFELGRTGSVHSLKPSLHLQHHSHSNTTRPQKKHCQKSLSDHFWSCNYGSLIYGRPNGGIQVKLKDLWLIMLLAAISASPEQTFNPPPSSAPTPTGAWSLAGYILCWWWWTLVQKHYGNLVSFGRVWISLVLPPKQIWCPESSSSPSKGNNGAFSTINLTAFNMNNK